MNIGGRIVLRLKELGWERKDLLARIPDLSQQALSYLIKRDSVRSEWDLQIAEALKVSVLWLVYGIDAAYKPSDQATPEFATDVVALPTRADPAEQELLTTFRTLDDIGKGMLLERAQIIATSRSAAPRKLKGA